MKRFFLVLAAVAATTTLGATDAAADRKTNPTKPGTDGAEFVISCFRGPFKTVVWDRPNAVFLDDLVEYGYDMEEAIAIGKRVCRDEYGVDNDDWMRSTLLRLLEEEPPASFSR